MDVEGTIFSHVPVVAEVDSLSRQEGVAFVGEVVVLRDTKNLISKAVGGVFFSVEEIIRPQ
jgi:hypothetical protein